jgi:hypothetical protein
MLRKLPITSQEAEICQAPRAGNPTRPCLGNDVLNADPGNERRRVGGDIPAPLCTRGLVRLERAKPDMNVRIHSQPGVSLPANANDPAPLPVGCVVSRVFGRISTAHSELGKS